MTDKSLRRLVLVHALMAFAEIFTVFHYIRANGIGVLMYYTELSNLLSGFASLYMVIRILQTKTVPLSAKVFRYISMCLTTVTFVVVLTVLGPTFGYAYMLFYGQMLITHTLCPIASILIFLFLEDSPALLRKHVDWAILPTVLYGIVTVFMNYIRYMTGPYPFLMVHDQPWYATVLWFVGILAGAYLIALGFYRWDQKRQKSDIMKA